MRNVNFLIVPLMLSVCLLGCNRYATGWRVVAAVQAAGNAADDMIAETAREKHRDCMEKHSGDHDKYEECIDFTKKILIAWVNIIRQNIDTALRATVTGLEIAEKVKSKNEYDWQESIKPAACSLIQVLNQIKTWIGEERFKKVQLYLDIFDGIIQCPKFGG